MPSSYTLSLRLTLQATGENNNTWGVILNQGVFGLVDYAIAGGRAVGRRGAETLTTALGATDEARAAFLDVTSGAGGQIVIPATSQPYFVRNASTGQVSVTAGGAVNALFGVGDAGPLFSDGANVYPLMLAGKPIGQFITDADQAVINYVNLAISGASVSLPPATGNLGKTLIVRLSPTLEAWVPDFIQTSDVQGLAAQLAANQDFAVAMALTL
jgi:hypothetical protein